jgi:hypothetical protein
MSLAGFAVVAVLSLVTILSAAKLGEATGTITKEELSGPWVMTLAGDTSCSISSLYIAFILRSVLGENALFVCSE